MNYIVKKGKAISTTKGIIGAPVDPLNPTEREIITIDHFSNGQKGLDAMLASPNCVLEHFSKQQVSEKSERPVLPRPPEDKKHNNIKVEKTLKEESNEDFEKPDPTKGIGAQKNK